MAVSRVGITTLPEHGTTGVRDRDGHLANLAGGNTSQGIFILDLSKHNCFPQFGVLPSHIRNIVVVHSRFRMRNIGGSNTETIPGADDSGDFCGSAPLLRQLVLDHCPFPGIPKLLLSATHLCHLDLREIPDLGYFSPQALGAALSVMSRLAALRVEFQLPRYPTSRPPLPLTRSVLPSLTRLVFEGVHEYLEDLLAQIEAPLLNKLRIIFFMDPQFVIPQLHRLINFAESFKKCHTAFVYTSYDAIRFAAFRETHQFPELSFDIRWGVLGRPLSLLAQVCSSSLHLLSTLVQLDIVVPVLSFPQSLWVLNNTRWLELLDPFTAVKDLRLSDQVAPHVCQALEELSEEGAPALQNIFLQGLESLEPVPNFIERVVAARRLSGHPVTVYPWEGRGNYDESTGMIF
ncbi:hypothetical protein F5148DRAFT_1153687 [Russula earlei]|uniref:Uncharacterized protein n=1 Tax=Russula earlei TaxID=71964 RepID=A0ACC0TT49_9AGAM|nr:hypothetical protein F5148DRAFT_1153687 [Russula earlei]